MTEKIKSRIRTSAQFIYNINSFKNIKQSLNSIGKSDIKNHIE